MSLVPQPTADDSRTNSTFEEMMWAMSRPGLFRTLPARGLATMAECLLDLECSFAAPGYSDLGSALTHSGARSVSIEEADYIFAELDSEDKIASLSGLKTGTLAYPDGSSTLLSPARFVEKGGVRLRLRGPGIRGVLTVTIDGVDPSFWILRERKVRYPIGFDVFLVDGDLILGIPRSTKIEVL